MTGSVRVYASALFELAKERGELDRVRQDLRAMADLCRGHGPLRALFARGALNAEQRQSLALALVRAQGAGPRVERFVSLLAQKGRLAEIGEMAEAFEAMVERSRGILLGEVRSAVELSPEEVTRLAAALGRHMGMGVLLQQKLDPRLLGGAVAVVGGRTFDASVRNQISRFIKQVS
jgi:F-type H+-transporting ATPase subunit delta